MRRLALLALVAGVGCGGGRPPAEAAPQSVTASLAEFMAAVKANDLTRMGALWGTERGPATGWMKEDQLRMRLTVIQRYLMHAGYRVVEGPLSPPGAGSTKSTVRIELQRPRCNVVLPIDLVRTRGGGWLVYDVHLESAGNPAAACGPRRPGTGR